MKHLLKIGLFVALMSLAMTGCSDKGETIGDSPRGYFQMNGYAPMEIFVPAEGGTVEYPLHIEKGDEVVPVNYVCFHPRQREEFTYWQEIYRERDWALNGEEYYKGQGLEDVPNSLDFQYPFHWVKLSTFTQTNAGMVSSLFRVEFEPNPYNQARFIYVHLENNDYGDAWIIQSENPEGFNPPEGWENEPGWASGNYTGDLPSWIHRH